MTFGTMKSRLACRGALARATAAVKPGRGLIRAEDVENCVRVRRRFDAADIHLLELFDVLEHLRKLRLKLRDLRLAQMQPRELRGVADIKMGVHAPLVEGNARACKSNLAFPAGSSPHTAGKWITSRKPAASSRSK